MSKEIGDLISRQEVIDAMNQVYCHVEMIRKRPVTKGEQALFLDMRETIKALPSAKPEHLVKESGDLVKDLVNDCISRQDAVKTMYDACEYIDRESLHIDVIVDALENLPSADVQPVVRCKDCKHKPHTSDKYDYDNGDCGFEIIFPDYCCPCRCEDEYYNYIPDDDWYCGNAQRG